MFQALPGVSHADYLRRFFQSPIGTQLLSEASPGGAGRNRTLNQKMLSATRIPLPPLPEQRKIAAILSAVDAVIERTQAVIDQLQQVKKALMQELLTRGIPGRHTRFKKTEIGEVPEGWEVVSLGSLCSSRPKYGANCPKAPFDPDLPRYIRITDITEDGELSSEDLASISHHESENYLLTEGDLLIARSGATVGKSYIYDTSAGLCAHAGYLIKFSLNLQRIDLDFVKHSLHSVRYATWVKESQRAQAQPNINANEYSTYLMAVPTISEQKEIGQNLESVDRRAQLERTSLATLRQLKSALMSVLLSGEVRVKVEEGAA